ncbi:MAG: glycosyltransferase family 39 protein [Lentisphaerae bacterium]|nr:glycosyltransferase family 39 protein [Lentisphaerota bacterium]
MTSNPCVGGSTAGVAAKALAAGRLLRLSVLTSRLVSNSRWWLVAIVGVGLALRLWGIGWGLPGRTELHPDEHDYVLRYALCLTPAQLDPGFLNYPSFLMYLIAATFRGLSHIGLISGATWEAFLIGRLWSALFATATVLPVFMLARELGGSRRGALLASLWMALLPLSVWEAHVAVTDPLMTFWVAMTLWVSVRLVRTARLYDYLLAGACLGLATGSKYTAALAVIAVVVGAVVSVSRGRSWGQACGGLCAAGAMSILSAYAVAPYSFIRFEDLLSAMAFESHHVAGAHLGFSVPANGWQYHRYLYQVVAAWPFSFGLALYVSVLAGASWVLLTFSRRHLPVLAFAVLFFGVTGSWTFVPLRYSMPLLVVGVLYAGLWQGTLLDSRRRAVRIAGRAIILVTLAYTAVFSVQTTARYANETRMQAANWMDATLPRGGTLALYGWSRYVAIPSRPADYTITGGRDDRLVRRTEAGGLAELIEITSMHRDRHVRHGDVDWMAAYDQLGATNSPLEFVVRFESHFINKRFYERLDPMYAGYFVSPTIEFYRPRHHPVAVTIPPAVPPRFVSIAGM